MNETAEGSMYTSDVSFEKVDCNNRLAECSTSLDGPCVTLSPSRQRNQWLMDPEKSAELEQSVKEMRKKITWFPSGDSKTAKPLSTCSSGKEYTSHLTLTAERRKQSRSQLNPEEKFDEPCLSSHELGWGLRKTPVQQPKFGISESPSTKYCHNMELTKSYHVLRFAR
eukprot:GHVQ01032630.1.p1 GENE.GHVQ01032630.1~~GHVQ01032630.1.p1  ORF type:complete len:168 (+),score=20.35 GHVQ01032630.1:218-721(+)